MRIFRLTLSGLLTVLAATALAVAAGLEDDLGSCLLYTSDAADEVSPV